MPRNLGNTFGYKHGHAVKGKETRTYRTWAQMTSRCRNSNHKDYKWYGARGIQVCSRWSMFENFLADMGERPEGLTIDRKDTNGNYCLSNCRWATNKQQHRNKRSNRMITHNGETKCVSAWAETLGVPPFILYSRLKRGWSECDTVVTPKRKRGQRLYAKIKS